MMKKAKRLLGCATISLGVLLLGGILFYLLVLKPLIPADPVLENLPQYETREFYTSGGFQDYTDYAKYTFGETMPDLEAHPSLRPVTGKDIAEIESYLDNFEQWVATCREFPQESYDFQREWLKEGDYFYIQNRYEGEEKKFWSYNVYYFRLENQTLYYFHNNI